MVLSTKVSVFEAKAVQKKDVSDRIPHHRLFRMPIHLPYHIA